MMREITADLIETLKQKIDELSFNLERMKLAEYVELLNKPRRLLYINFISGLARGLGIAVGFTLLGALALFSNLTREGSIVHVLVVECVIGENSRYI
jgi:hypothetical protein